MHMSGATTPSTISLAALGERRRPVEPHDERRVTPVARRIDAIGGQQKFTIRKYVVGAACRRSDKPIERKELTRGQGVQLRRRRDSRDHHLTIGPEEQLVSIV